MQNNHAAQTRPQNHLDFICYNRLQATNFAKHQTLASKLIHWMNSIAIQAGAK